MKEIENPPTAAALLRTRANAFDIIDVPEFGFAVVEGQGSPDDKSFQQALEALFAVSYRAHFYVKRNLGTATKVMPLEAQWWVDDPDVQRQLLSGGMDAAGVIDVDKSQWAWRAMISQPSPIDAGIVAAVVDELRTAKPVAGLDRLSYERWAEGLCAQVLHVGPYSAEGPSVRRLHEGIAAAGYRPRGRHHEIYLGDPRRSAPDKLRTLLRQPIELVTLER